ncbi:peptidase family C78-domain-containing protein [Rhodocollybia butyracea]|uniref:Peptidase family C78-domain-containing protein n=1 Tax=Rhodocollybia butyracea TaxID=206335 RepID=A0A9P5Q2L9_9AGAR|nr:peptidase family C78-domain-containing protein [Rhodocollybia butyracea]
MHCQLCYANIESLSISERQRHYDAHFQEPQANASNHPRSGSLKKSSSWTSKGKWRIPTAANLENDQDVFWYPAIQTLPPSNFTPGLVPVLKKALLKSHAKGTTTRAVLCYDRALYISRQIWDAGWGCGYRNFLMSCAALMDQPYQPLYFPLLDGPIPPGIRNLQVWIEEAWNNGFDQEGHAQLKKLVDTNKWVGTSDLCVAFLSRGIPAELVDFEIKDSNKSLTPLTNWIVQYFDKHSKKLNHTSTTVTGALLGASPVHCAPCMPLILQNDGHSCMVIGYELTKSGTVNLLVFDPSRPPPKRLRNKALSEFSSALSLRNKRRSRESTSGGNLPFNFELKSKRFKMNGKTTDDGSEVIWVDDEDNEIEFVGQRTLRDEQGEVKFVGQVSHKKDSEPTVPVDEPSYNDVLKHFRWEIRTFTFKRKYKYQILHFPLEEPLTEGQKRRKKVLTSEKIS